MKVMLLHNRCRSNGPSGENRVVDTESEALAAAGHEVIRFGRNSDEIENWPVAKKALLPARVVWNRGTHRELAAALRAHRPDVVHVHNTFPLLSDTVLRACRDAAVPVVATIHNYRLGCTSGDFFRDGAVCHDCAHGPLMPGVVHGCYRGSRAASVPLALSIGVHRSAWKSLVSAYVFISASQRDLLAGLRLPAERLFVRHNMIPYRQARSARRDPTVVYAGRLAEVKGLRVLMEAWDRYRGGSDDPGLRLVIAGSGPMEREMAGWAVARPSVEMLGLVTGSRCSELMSQARAVIVPSAWEEPFGLVVVEAMAAGTPPIASGHGSFTELITPGADGTLFRPGDSVELASVIADVAADAGKYETYGKQARETYEQRFNPARSLKHLLEIYSFAIANPAVTHGGLSQCNRDYDAASLLRPSGVRRQCRCAPRPWPVTTCGLSGTRSAGCCEVVRPRITPMTWIRSTWISFAGSCPLSPAPRLGRPGRGYASWKRMRNSTASSPGGWPPIPPGTSARQSRTWHDATAGMRWSVRWSRKMWWRQVPHLASAAVSSPPLLYGTGTGASPRSTLIPTPGS
jgi:glycosyltransferase involved in cell wall biosynthesis